MIETIQRLINEADERAREVEGADPGEAGEVASAVRALAKAVQKMLDNWPISPVI